MHYGCLTYSGSVYSTRCTGPQKIMLRVHEMQDTHKQLGHCEDSIVTGSGVYTIECYKNPQRVAISCCTKMVQKYPGYGHCHLAVVMLFGARVSAVLIRGWAAVPRSCPYIHPAKLGAPPPLNFWHRLAGYSNVKVNAIYCTRTIQLMVYKQIWKLWVYTVWSISSLVCLLVEPYSNMQSM